MEKNLLKTFGAKLLVDRTVTLVGLDLVFFTKAIELYFKNFFLLRGIYEGIF